MFDNNLGQVDFVDFKVAIFFNVKYIKNGAQ